LEKNEGRALPKAPDRHKALKITCSSLTSLDKTIILWKIQFTIRYCKYFYEKLVHRMNMYKLLQRENRGEIK